MASGNDEWGPKSKADVPDLHQYSFHEHISWNVIELITM